MLVIKKQPYLQMPLTDGVTVMWETDAPGSSEVEVWLSHRRHTECIPGDFTGLFSGAPGTVHRVRISGLQPQAGYHYRVRSVRGEDTLESGYFEFCTQCETGTPFSFCVTSETGGYGGFNEVNFNDRLFAAMKEQRPDFLVFAGDMASNGRDWEDWNKYMFHPGAALLSSTPFYLCQGNHEENTPLLPALFSFPEPMNYYSFDYGSAHFTVLDSTTLFQYRELPDGTFDAVETAEFTPESPQMRFLVNDLEQTAADWRFVVFIILRLSPAFTRCPAFGNSAPYSRSILSISYSTRIPSFTSAAIPSGKAG